MNYVILKITWNLLHYNALWTTYNFKDLSLNLDRFIMWSCYFKSWLSIFGVIWSDCVHFQYALDFFSSCDMLLEYIITILAQSLKLKLKPDLTNMFMYSKRASISWMKKQNSSHIHFMSKNNKGKMSLYLENTVALDDCEWQRHPKLIKASHGLMKWGRLISHQPFLPLLNALSFRITAATIIAQKPSEAEREPVQRSRSELSSGNSSYSGTEQKSQGCTENRDEDSGKAKSPEPAKSQNEDKLWEGTKKVIREERSFRTEGSIYRRRVITVKFLWRKKLEY